MAATRASKKAEQAETKAEEQDATSQSAPTAPEGKADTGVPPTAPEDAEEAEPSKDPSGHTDEDIAEAIEANPDAPEEELDTEYLPGGEVPVSAPGTEGIDRA